MAISNYSELQTAISNWIDRSDIDDRIKEFIALGEARIYRELRIRAMDFGDGVLTITNGILELPSDFIELRDAAVVLSGGRFQTLEFVTTDYMRRKYPNRTPQGIPLTVKINSSNRLGFGPFPDQNYNISIRYYARFPPLSDSNTTNWFTDNAPDILMWASLVESTAYTMDDDRLQVWESKYQQAKFEIQKEDNKARRSGSPVRAIPG